MGTYFVIVLALLSSCSNYNVSKFNIYVAEAKYLYSIGEWDESIKTIEQIEKYSYPPDELLVLKARGQRQLEKSDDAFITLKSEIEKRPHSELIALELAQWYLDHEQIPEAKNLALGVLQRGNPSYATRKVLGFSYMKLGEWPRAQAILEAFTSSPDEEAIFWLGQSYYKQYHYRAAAAAFTKSFNASIVFRKRAAQYLAWIHTEMKEVAAANIYIRYLIKDNPQDLYAQKMLLRNILNMNQADKITMLILFNDSFKDEWGQHQYYTVLKNNGMKKEAMYYLGQEWNKTPDKLWIAANYARDLQGSGNLELAKVVLEKFISVASNRLADVDIIKDHLAKLSPKVQQSEMVSKVAEQATAVSEGNRKVSSLGRSYKVEAGDTFQKISRKFFDTSKRWGEIHNLNINKIPHPENLKSGMTILIPEGAIAK